MGGALEGLRFLTVGVRGEKIQMVVRYSGTKNRLYTHIIVYSHLHKNPFQIFLKITSLMGASIVSDKKLNSEI